VKRKLLPTSVQVQDEDAFGFCSDEELGESPLKA